MPTAPFDPMRMGSYTTKEMADYIESGEVSKDELYMNGYPATKRPALEEELDRRARLPIEDDETWAWASRTDTVAAYEKYLRKYDTREEGAYRGKYVMDARSRIEDLRELATALREELFQAMRNSPWLFKAETVYYLVNGIHDPNIMNSLRSQGDIASRFICTGQTITFDEICQEGIVPPEWTLEKVMAPDFALPQTNIRELGNFPTDGRTDVYFLGVPRGGKSSVMAGIFYEMFSRGQMTYEPQFNAEGVDKCNAYFKGLIKAVDAAKFPVSTPSDSISFMKLKLNTNNRENPLTFVEIAGEDFKRIAHGHELGPEVWERIGAAQCLKSNNRKLLAFIVDFSIARGGVRSDNDVWNDMEQAMVLEEALTVLGHDGRGKDNTVGCTLSKVDSVAVIVTKSDLMGDNLTSEQKTKMAQDYLSRKFSNFMNHLCDECRKHGINAPIRYAPYILTFSLGRLLIGNTYHYDPADASNIINFISAVTTNRRRR